jgi:hypothetical protein
MPDMLPRISLLAAAVAFGAFGTVLFVAPQLLELAGVTAIAPEGAVELRAFYGGLELGIAVFFVIAATKLAWIRPALVLQIAVFGGLAAARSVALLLPGAAGNAVIYAALGGEVLGAVVGIAAYVQHGTFARSPSRNTRTGSAPAA